MIVGVKLLDADDSVRSDQTGQVKPAVSHTNICAVWNNRLNLVDCSSSTAVVLFELLSVLCDSRHVLLLLLALSSQVDHRHTDRTNLCLCTL